MTTSAPVLTGKNLSASPALAQQNADPAASTLSFINFYLANPNDTLSKAFTTVITSKSQTLSADVSAFFAQYPAYSACTLQTYLTGIVTKAPASLSTLIQLLGGVWPGGMPDITIANPSCSFTNGTLDISFELDFTTLSFENAIIAANVKKLVTQTSIQASLTCNFQPASNIFESKISIQFSDIKLPVSSSDSLTITAPTVSLDFTPAFKYVVFTLTGAIPATIFNTPIDIDLSLVVDNDEANIGASIVGSNVSLSAPPGVKGLHFDEIGVGMGLFFDPLGFAFGIEGKFHIGDTTNTIVDLDDNTFAVVCEYVEEAIAPKYAGFYVPKLDLNTVLELFTNANLQIDVPVNFTDLSFHWSSGLNDSIALPDGTLSPSGYGFSAGVDIFSFGFYGEMNLDETTGLSANVELSPITLGKVFKLTGDGKGYSIKVDQNGNPIKNNQVINTTALQNAVANATDKQLVAPGGASLVINTVSQPMLHLNAQASLFDLLSYDIAADINSNGITFELDFGAILTEKMVCNLSGLSNFYGSFGYAIDKSIPLPTIGGVNPGTIPLKADADLHLSIITTTTDIVISTGGQFGFEGYQFTFGDFSADINISKISDFVGAIVQYIVDEAKTIFNQLLDTAEHWAAAAGKGIITGFDDAGKVMKNVFNKTEQDMTTILKAAGFAANDIANALKNGYNAASQDVAAIMKAAGYTATEIGGAIKNAWNCGIDDVSWALQQVGIGAADVANAVKGAFNAGAQDVANTLKKWGYAADDVANVIKNIFGGDSIAVASIMKQADYAIDDISRGIKDAWNCTANDVTYALKAVGYTADEVAVSLNNVFNAASQDVAAALKAMGYTADEVASAIKNCWNCAVNDVTWAMHYVGYTANEMASGLKSAFNAAAQDVANSFKAFGIAAQDTANAIKTVYNLAINDTASVLKQAGYAATDVASALKNAFNTTADAVAAAMKAVGYAGNDVKNAFESLGGDFKNFADSAWKTLSNPDTWNPSKW